MASCKALIWPLLSLTTCNLLSLPLALLLADREESLELLDPEACFKNKKITLLTVVQGFVRF